MTQFSNPLFPSPADWRDLTFYQIFTDRFADGDTSNNESTPGARYEPAKPHGIHGGDFQGIEQHLDYIQGLGAKAIWITPVFLNESNSAWHGYGAINFDLISPQLGGLKALRDLIQSSHRRGIYVLIDVVANHTGDVITSDDPGWPSYRPTGEGYHLRWRDPKTIPPPPFNNLNWYHNRGRIENWNDPTQSVIGQFFTLSDLRTELPEVRAALLQVYQKLIRETNCDGFRVDTVRHVERSFWGPWCTAIRAYATSLGKTNFLLFGEVADRQDEKLAIFTVPEMKGEKVFDSLLDFPFYYAIREVVGLAEAPTRQLTQRWQHLAAPPYSRDSLTQLVTFIDNHDQPRFMAKESADGDPQRLRQALVLLYTSIGIPCLYYGTEQGFQGGHDPFNREDMIGIGSDPKAVNHFDPKHPLYEFIARLIQVRDKQPALRKGSLKVVLDNRAGPGLFAFVRQLGKDYALIILNTADEVRTIKLARTPLPSHAVLRSALDPVQPMRLGGSGGLAATKIPPKAAWILVKSP